MRNKSPIVLIFVLLLSCASHQGFYYPSGSFSEDSRTDHFKYDWYVDHLKSMKEKPLVEITSSKALRILVLPTSGRPEVLRLSAEQNGVYQLFYLQTNGVGGGQSGEIIAEKRKSISNELVEEIFSQANDHCNIGSAKSHGVIESEEGEQWVLEWLNDGRLHAFDLWSPQKGCFFNLYKQLSALIS